MTWQSINRFARGHKRDPEGHRRTAFRMLAAGLQSLPHLGASLLGFAPPTFDQSRTSGCTGHAYACAVTTALAAQGQPLGFVVSPRMLYALGRCIDRHPNLDGTFPPLTDTGSEPNALCRAMSEWGVSPMGPLVPEGYSDVNTANVNVEPSLGDLVVSAAHVVVGEYAIDASSSSTLADECATALDNGLPFTLSVPGGSDAWQQYTAGVLGPVPPAQSALDHEVVCLGYRPATDGLEFLIRNSWGAGYGLNGNLWISQAAMGQCADQVAMKVGLL